MDKKYKDKDCKLSRVRFGYDITKDAWSWVIIARSKDLWGMDLKKEVEHIPKDLLIRITKGSEKEAVKLTEEYIRNRPEQKYMESVTSKVISALERS